MLMQCRTVTTVHSLSRSRSEDGREAVQLLNLDYGVRGTSSLIQFLRSQIIVGAPVCGQRDWANVLAQLARVCPCLLLVPMIMIQVRIGGENGTQRSGAGRTNFKVSIFFFNLPLVLQSGPALFGSCWLHDLERLPLPPSPLLCRAKTMMMMMQQQSVFFQC